MSRLRLRPRGRGAARDQDSEAVDAQLDPKTRLDKILTVVPRALSSHADIIFLGVLGVYLVLLPLVGVSGVR